MKLIDTHSHLYLPPFENDLEQVCQNARNNYVDRIYLPNIDSETIPAMLKLEADYPDLFFPMVGLHPTSVKDNYKEELKVVKEWLEKRSFSAVGEIGIDLYWDKTFAREQEIAFEQQITWAKELGLPIVIHSRNSFREIFEVVGRNKDEKLYGIFHSFSGTVEEARHIIELGFKIGVNGIVTFKNSDLDNVVQQIDINHLVLETDSPFLAPVPKRGKRNESSYVYHVAVKIAEIKNIPVEEVAKVTTENALKIFKR